MKFLRRLLIKRRDPRLIFEYRINGRSVAADPIVVQRQLESDGSAEWRTLFSVVNTLSRQPSDAEASLLTTADAWKSRAKRRDAAIFELAVLSRRAFNLPNLQDDGSGVTEAEAIDILSQFVSFIGELASQARGFR